MHHKFCLKSHNLWNFSQAGVTMLVFIYLDQLCIVLLSASALSRLAFQKLSRSNLRREEVNQSVCLTCLFVQMAKEVGMGPVAVFLNKPRHFQTALFVSATDLAFSPLSRWESQIACCINTTCNERHRTQRHKTHVLSHIVWTSLARRDTPLQNVAPSSEGPDSSTLALNG